MQSSLQNDRPEAVTSDLPEQRKNLAGPSAFPILPEAWSAGNRREPEPIGVVLARVYRILVLAGEGGSHD